MAQEHELTGIQLKLRSTPTAGLDGEHSPYYRRLLSAGYKGFLQGTIGGSTLYGALGLGVGAAVALPAFFLMGGAPLAFMLVPLMGGLGVMKGASTFGNIGSFAAISAESAEMSEKRRYLLDRYHELPDTPEFDAEAHKIQEILEKQNQNEKPKSMFHVKTVLICAALGAALAFGLLALPGSHLALLPVLETLGIASAHAIAPVGLAIGTMLGAAAGATIGLDRYYVRKWFDNTQTVVHDPSKVEKALRARELEVESLGTRVIPRGYSEAQAQPAQSVAAEAPQTALPEEQPAKIEPSVIASAKPSTKASDFSHMDRLGEINRAMANPTL